MKTCALCKLNKELCNSHLIPKFVSDWIKSTSATGYMRSTGTPNLRVQDSRKVKLLCKECEDLFSVHEKYFAETIFRPFMNSNTPVIEYNSHLLKFGVSLSWRILINSISSPKNNHKHVQELKEAEKNWRDYLLSNDLLHGYEHHMLMLKYVEGAPKISGTDMDINWYFFRTIDATIVQNQNESFVFVKLPGFSFFSAVKPKHFSHTDNTHISYNGEFDFNIQSQTNAILKYLNHRSIETISAAQNMSKIQLNRIETDCLKDLDRVGDSFGYKLFLKRELSKNKKMKQ